MMRKRVTGALLAGATVVSISLVAVPRAHAAPVAAAKTPTVAQATRVPTAVPTTAATAVSASRLDRRCRTGRVICVSKTDRKVYWVVNGRIRMVMDARFGGARTPTRNGSFRVYWKSRKHVSSLYHTKMPYSLFFSRGQAVHYSPDFAQRGYRGASHGCVNTRNLRAMAALFAAVRVGDRVVVYRR